MSGTANAFQKAAAHIEQMRKDCIYTDGALPSRTKALAAMLWSVSVRCEPCLAHYARKAIELGASRDELAEMLDDFDGLNWSTDDAGRLARFNSG